METFTSFNVKKEYNVWNMFRGYKGYFPTELTGVFQPHEYLDIIAQYNSIFQSTLARRLPWLILVALSGVIVIIAGTFKNDLELIYIGTGLTMVFTFTLIIFIVIYMMRVKKQIYALTNQLNHIYFSRGIQFNVTRKILSMKGRKTRYRLEVTFPRQTFVQPTQQPIYSVPYIPQPTFSSYQQTPQHPPQSNSQMNYSQPQQQVYSVPYIPQPTYTMVQPQSNNNNNNVKPQHNDMSISIDQGDLSTPLMKQQY